MVNEKKKQRRQLVHALQAEARKVMSLDMRLNTTIAQQKAAANVMTQRVIAKGALDVA